MKRFSWLILIPAVLSLAGTLKEQLENFQPGSADERIFKAVAPDDEWGKPLYLYSKKGTPYRCYVNQDGLPLRCRRTEAGEETLEAMKQRPLEYKQMPK
jgi:hypothetical protein